MRALVTMIEANGCGVSGAVSDLSDLVLAADGQSKRPVPFRAMASADSMEADLHPAYNVPSQRFYSVLKGAGWKRSGATWTNLEVGAAVDVTIKTIEGVGIVTRLVVYRKP